MEGDCVARLVQKCLLDKCKVEFVFPGIPGEDAKYYFNLLEKSGTLNLKNSEDIRYMNFGKMLYVNNAQSESIEEILKVRYVPKTLDRYLEDNYPYHTF